MKPDIIKNIQTLGSIQGTKSSTLDAALTYAELGWPVFPCKPDRKPATEHGFKDATTDADIIMGWFGGSNRMIGIPTGEHFFVVDIDNKPKKGGNPEVSRAELTEKFSLPETQTAKTQSGGYHLYFKMPVGFEIKCSTSKLAPCVDIRGVGGYIIAPPSIGAAGKYQWINDTPIVEAPQSLIDALRSLNTPQKKQNTQKLAGHTSDYGRTALEQEVTKVASTQDGERNDALNKSAFAVGQLIAGGEIDEAEANDRLTSAAISAGLTEQEVARTLRSGFDSGKLEPRSAPEPEPWGEPILFNDYDVPPLNTNKLPEILGDIVIAGAESLQVPPELVLTGCLGAMASVSQSKFKVKISKDYYEPVNLYILCGLPPGERKSATLSLCKKPVVAIEKRLRENAEPEIQRMKSEFEIIEKRISALEKKAANAKEETDIESYLEEIKHLRERQVEPKAPPRLLVDDVTPEALAVALATQKNESLAMLEAEGGIFETVAGRYSNGVANLDLILKAWNGESVRIDRKTSGCLSLEHPLLTICITPQPDVIRGLSDKPGFKGRGLIGRFFYLLPKSRLGTRDMEPPEMKDGVLLRYFDKIESIAAIPYTGEPRIFELSDGAYAARLDFVNNIESNLGEGGEFAGMTDSAAKVQGQVARIAGIFHLYEYESPETLQISKKSMDQAIELCWLFLEHAKIAMDLMECDQNTSLSKKICEWIKKQQNEQFSGRDCFIAMRGSVKKMDKLKSSLEELMERGIIREQPQKLTNKAGRRPSQVYEVNPAIFQKITFTQNSQNTQNRSES